MESYSRLQKNLVDSISMRPENIPNKLQLRWNNKSAVARANKLSLVLGNPHRYSPQVGGVAIWYYVDPYFRQANLYPVDTSIRPTNVYSKLMIKDEAIPHLVPSPHTDWFYAYMYMDVPSDKVETVTGLTESVTYDTMKKEIRARCHFMPANLTTLFLAKQLANGHKKLSHAQQEYGVLISTLAQEEMSGAGITMKEQMGPWHRTLTEYTFGLD
jgi:hypothetical protein